MNAQNPIRNAQIRPTNPFTPFKNEEIEQSVPERFEQQVRAYGERLAIQSDQASFTFVGLNQAANRLAHRILPSATSALSRSRSCSTMAPRSWPQSSEF